MGKVAKREDVSLRQRLQQIVPLQLLSGHSNQLPRIVGHPSEAGQHVGVVQVEGQGRLPCHRHPAGRTLHSAASLYTDVPKSE
jgi:hypothetical protein